MKYSQFFLFKGLDIYSCFNWHFKPIWDYEVKKINLCKLGILLLTDFSSLIFSPLVWNYRLHLFLQIKWSGRVLRLTGTHSPSPLKTMPKTGILHLPQAIG